MKRPTSRRLRVITALAAMITPFVVVLSPNSAQAAETLVPCPTNAGLVWRMMYIDGSIFPWWIADRYTVTSATPRFMPADGRSVDNLLDTPITSTFSSSRSRTFTVAITTSIGVGEDLAKEMQFSVDTEVTASNTTMIGINSTVTVPPHTRVTGEYGVSGYAVTYTVERYRSHFLINSKIKCRFDGGQQGSGTAPTNIEGWRFSSTPL